MESKSSSFIVLDVEGQDKCSSCLGTSDSIHIAENNSGAIEEQEEGVRFHKSHHRD